MSDSAELFRQRLRKAISEYGAGAELGRRSGINRTLIDKWARGITSPGLESLDRIASALGVSPADLISEEDEDRPWERVPKHLLLALAQVHPDHYTIVMNFLESFTVERERSSVSKASERLEQPSRGGKKRR